MPTIPWQEVREIVDAVIDLPADELAQFLDGSSLQPSMRRYVESLVLSFEQSDQLFKEPAIAAMANEIAEGVPGARV